MMKKSKTGKFLAAGTAMLLLVVVFFGCGAKADTEPESPASESSSAGADRRSTGPAADGSANLAEGESGAGEETENLAMYVPCGENGYVMVDQETGALFTVTMPEDIRDADGNSIGQEGLERGNILRIYGNGIMLESYPGQYPGVTRIQVEEEGDPSDADQYQEMIDGICPEADPSEIPSMSVEYRTPQAITTVTTMTGGYQWNYETEDGSMKSVIADASHITEWEFQDDIRLEEPADMTLLFSTAPEKVTVSRWAEGQSADTQPEGEKVEVQTGEDGLLFLEKAAPGYRYLICAEWENGSVEYGFRTVGG